MCSFHKVNLRFWAHLNSVTVWKYRVKAWLFWEVIGTCEIQGPSPSLPSYHDGKRLRTQWGRMFKLQSEVFDNMFLNLACPCVSQLLGCRWALGVCLVRIPTVYGHYSLLLLLLKLALLDMKWTLWWYPSPVTTECLRSPWCWVLTFEWLSESYCLK